jgi:hypothetical protein
MVGAWRLSWSGESASEVPSVQLVCAHSASAREFDGLVALTVGILLMRRPRPRAPDGT